MISLRLRQAFVFEQIASGRSLTILAIIDNGAHEAVAVHVQHTIGGDHWVWILECTCASRDYPQIIRSDNAIVT